MGFRPICGIGIEDEIGNYYWWKLDKEKMIQVEYPIGR